MTLARIGKNRSIFFVGCEIIDRRSYFKFGSKGVSEALPFSKPPVVPQGWNALKIFQFFCSYSGVRKPGLDVCPLPHPRGGGTPPPTFLETLRRCWSPPSEVGSRQAEKYSRRVFLILKQWRGLPPRAIYPVYTKINKWYTPIYQNTFSFFSSINLTIQKGIAMGFRSMFKPMGGGWQDPLRAGDPPGWRAPSRAKK